MRYLKTAKVFVGQPDQLRAACEIIKGLHDYFPYAQEFWLEHLSAAAEVANDETPDQEIKAMSEELATLFLKEKQQHPPPPRDASDPDQPPSLEDGIHAPDGDVSHLHPTLVSLARPLQGLLNFRYPQSQRQRRCENLGKNKTLKRKG